MRRFFEKKKKRNEGCKGQRITRERAMEKNICPQRGADYVLFHLCSSINEHWHRARWSTHFEAFSCASTLTIKAFPPSSPSTFCSVRGTSTCIRPHARVHVRIRSQRAMLFLSFLNVLTPGSRETASPFLKAASIMRVKGEKKRERKKRTCRPIPGNSAGDTRTARWYFVQPFPTLSSHTFITTRKLVH